jgi:sortase A
MMRRALRALSTVLIVSGSLLILDAGLTLAWQEPISAVYARITQNHLDGQLRKLEREAPTPLELKALAGLHGERRRIAFLARRLDARVHSGQAIGRIRIPAIGVRFVVVQGTGAGDLRKGPGHYPDTPLPGERGTVAIAGHRTTYLAPFRRLDDIERGDQIELEMPYGRFYYAYERTRVVEPSALWVKDRVRYDRLVLTACHPLYSASKRIVVFARLVRTEPRGAALAGT